MGKLEKYFDLPDLSNITKEIKISDRLGEIAIRAISEPTLQEIRKRSKLTLDNSEEAQGNGKFNLLIMQAGMIDPDFSNADFLMKVGYETPTDFVLNKFLPGEIATVANNIMQLSGFDMGINERVKEAKNS